MAQSATSSIEAEGNEGTAVTNSNPASTPETEQRTELAAKLVNRFALP